MVMPATPPPKPDTPASSVQHDDDPRVARTLRAMGEAMRTVLDGGDFDDVTVQDLLQHAGISRATFYAHFRNKEDALLSSFERMLEAFWRGFEGRAAFGERVAPAAELIAHIGESPARLEALRSGGRLDELWRMAIESFARRLDSRLPDTGGAPLARRLAARMLAASLVELVQWAAQHPGTATPRALDAQFHAMVWRTWGRT
jgi:AcrR family transcriptional regulator